MFRVLCASLILSSAPVFSEKRDPATKGDIELLVHQIDKRFEQIDRRFERLLWFIGILTTAVLAVLGYVFARLSKLDMETRVKSIDVAALAIAIKKADPLERKILREALR